MISLLVILGCWVGFNLLIVPFMEHSMIYFPFREIDQTPEYLGIKYEDVFLKTADGKTIHGWFVENKGSDKVILYFHGNGGNISHRLHIIKLLHELPVNVFMIDYHGYGRSEGRPSEQNLYLDAKASYDYLITQKKYRPSQIVLMGRSVGGAVAAHLAAQEKVKAVVLESTFSTGKDMARHMSVLFTRPIIWIRSNFDSVEKIGLIKVPILIIHSKEDEMIPYRMSQALYEKAREPKRLLLLEKGGHNEYVLAPEYIEGLREIVR